MHNTAASVEQPSTPSHMISRVHRRLSRTTGHLQMCSTASTTSNARTYNILSTFELHPDAKQLFDTKSTNHQHPTYKLTQHTGSVINKQQLHDYLKDTEYDAAICTLTTKIDPAVYHLISSYSHQHRCRVISTMSVGYDHIDIPAATQAGVLIGHTPDVLNDTVADTCIALCLLAARRIIPSVDIVKQGKWSTWSPFSYCGHDLHHSTVGIVGLGRIAQAVIRRLKAFDCNIIYYSPDRKQQLEQQLNITYVTLPELLRQSDFVIPQCALTDETKQMFDMKLFKQMKPTACFVNTTRGGIVNESDLYTALSTGVIGSAGLDVTAVEPLKADSPLLKLDNCVIFPHIGSASMRTRIDMMKLACTNVINALTGEIDNGRYVNADKVNTN